MTIDTAEVCCWHHRRVAVQADHLSSTAAATRTARDMASIRDADRLAISAQKEALELTREAEAAWAEATALDSQAALLTESARAGEVKARRLSFAGRRAAEAQEAADLLLRQAASAAAAAEQLSAASAEAAAKTAVRFCSCALLGCSCFRHREQFEPCCIANLRCAKGHLQDAKRIAQPIQNCISDDMITARAPQGVGSQRTLASFSSTHQAHWATNPLASWPHLT